MHFRSVSLFLAFGLVATVSLSGCATSARPKVRLKGVQILTTKAKMARLGIDVAVYNPNRFAIPLEAGQATVRADGDVAGWGALAKPVRLPARETVDVMVPVTLSMAFVQQHWTDLLSARTLTWSVRGSVSVQGFPSPIPVSWKGSIPRKTLEYLEEMELDRLLHGQPGG